MGRREREEINVTEFLSQFSSKFVDNFHCLRTCVRCTFLFDDRWDKSLSPLAKFQRDSNPTEEEQAESEEKR